MTLGAATGPATSTPERLIAFGKGADPTFEMLNFNYGRYLLIASSRAGGLPANLQGIWNNSNNPPWRCDYHSDINVDMAYWPAEVTNLMECHQPFFDYIETCDILGVEPAGRDKAALIREKLHQLQIGKWGQLQEWLEDKDDPKDQHRHLSHLIGVYPGRQTIAGRDEALAQAARVSLNARGDGGAGWCLPWKAALWARLGDTERAYQVLRRKLQPVIGWQGGMAQNVDGTFPNLLTAVWGCFQADGNFGYSAAVAEMLLQSHAGEISLLPALPKAWAKQGSFTGLRARGGHTVDCAWQDGKVISYQLRSAQPVKVKVRVNGVVEEVSTTID